MDPELRQFIQGFLAKRDQDIERFHLQALQGDGSRRLFWRITPPRGGSSFIAMVNPPTDPTARRENYAYLMIGRHLRRKGVPVPRIYSYDLESGWFVVEDMGETSLHDLLASRKEPLTLYEKVLGHLFRLQIEGAKGFDTRWCCQTKRYDLTVMRQYESNYFRDAFLCDYMGLKREWIFLETPLNHLARTASKADGGFFLHRDFQSRNLMVSKGDIGIVDWQGGRLGPLGYDLASLLIDPYSGLSIQFKSELYLKYLLLINDYNPRWIDPFKRYYPYLAIQRNLQILGAFSYLTKTMKKDYFEAYIPAALRSLNDLLYEVNDPKLSPLRDLVGDLQPAKKLLDRSDPVL